MNLTSNLSVVLVILLLSFPVLVQSQAGTSASELQMGVDAYKSSQYDDAMRHFEKAVELDGADLRARLYLATACVSQYIPGIDTAENIRSAEHAIEQYKYLLDQDAERSTKVSSAKGIAYLYLNMKKFDEAKTYYRMAIDLDPQDPENYYSIGVIDWTKCYEPRIQERSNLGLRPEDHLDPGKPYQRRICEELRAKNTPAIEEGIENLTKAINLRPDYDDAMAYINLMYREKADLECEDLAARAQDLRTADDWVDKTLAIKKAKAEKAAHQVAPTAPNPQ